MYEFIDVTEVSTGAHLPSEALKINGEYIENLVPGYRTLYVSGRESLAPELSTYETGRQDGSRLSGRRYPARTIVVGYRLVASSASAFRSAYNSLSRILNVEEAELIFFDEPDKFFTGTPSGLGEIEPGRNSVTGEIEFTCLDPFKYSVKEYEVTPTLDGGTTFAINYNGTYKSYPTIEVTFPGDIHGADCGYVAFVNARGNVIQAGDPEEVDGISAEKSQTLIYDNFAIDYTKAMANWSTNNGLLYNSADVQTGSVKNGSGATAVNSYGTGSKWHGPAIVRKIPADALGEEGAENFRFTCGYKMAVSSSYEASEKQRGKIQIFLINSKEKKILAGYDVAKSTASHGYRVGLYAIFEHTETVDFVFGDRDIPAKKSDTLTIKKEGNKVTISSSFNMGADEIWVPYWETVDQIVIYFSQYGKSPALSSLGITHVKFVKDMCDTYKDIPNKFSTNDKLVIDCDNGEIELNENPAPELGALGNDWENFYLEPGMNQIHAGWSDWMKGIPAFKLRYREAFL